MVPLPKFGSICAGLLAHNPQVFRATEGSQVLLTQ
jgi:hypothetical protein